MGWIQEPFHETGDDETTSLRGILSKIINSSFVVFHLAGTKKQLKRNDNSILFAKLRYHVTSLKEIYAHPLVMFAEGWPEK